MRNFALLSFIVVLGCGGSSSTQASGETETTGGETASADQIPWEQMTHEQRGHFMAHVVMPAMQPIFQDHDATRYAEFSCGTCHGANAHDVNFMMPNGLHPLDHATIMATFQSQDPSATWMTQHVWPRMAELLGEEPFDQATGSGFRCTDCHADGEPHAAAP